MPSGCVWWTCGAGTNACSSVSIDGPRHGGVELAAHEVGDHVLVAHLVARDQRQHLLQAQRREARGAHRGEVAARALDPHDRALGAGVVDGRCPWPRCCRRRSSRRRGRRRAGSRRARGRRADRPARVPFGGPEVGGGGDQLGGGAHRAPHRSARSAAMRSERPDARSAATGSSAAPSARARARAERPHVGVVGVEQHLVAAEHVAARARGAQRLAVDDQRPRIGVLDVDDAHHHRLDLRLDVVGLVDRQARQRPAAAHELAEDEEQLERVDRADDQVVVGVLAVVEVEAAEAILRGEDRDDLLDVHALRVVAHVDEHARPLAERAGRRAAPSPSRRGRWRRTPARRACTRRGTPARRAAPRRRARARRACARAARAGRPGPGSWCRRRATATAPSSRASRAISMHSSRCSSAFARIAASGFVIEPST